MSGTVLPDRTLIRLGAVSAVLGVVVLIGGNAIHGGDDPANLAVSLPQYAANGNWVVAHILQFLGFLLILGGLVGLHPFKTLVGNDSATVEMGAFVAHGVKKLVA